MKNISWVNVTAMQLKALYNWLKNVVDKMSLSMILKKMQ